MCPLACELFRCSVRERGVRALLIVFIPPAGDLAACIPQVPEPTRIQAFVPQAAVKALDMAVLDRLSGLDVNEFDPPINSPGEEVA